MKEDFLYERAKEKGILLQKLQEIVDPPKNVEQSGPKGKMVLISGESGSGKTVLALALQEPTKAANGHFIHGKFDQFQKNSQNVIAGAFGQYASIVLQDKDMLVSVQTAVGRDARCLVDMIPSLASVFSNSSNLMDDISDKNNSKLWMEDMTTIKSRTRSAFLRFVSTVTHPERPCVLFVDDLQWATPADYQVISDLLTCVSENINGLLLVGASRLVDPTHELTTFTQSLSEKVDISNVILSDLSATNLQEYLGNLFPTMDMDDASTLAEIVYLQTEGNLFFVKHLVDNLLEQGLIQDSKDSSSLDRNRLESRTKSEDVVHFIVANLRCLCDDTQSLLKVAACLGVNFSSHLIESVLADFTVVSINTILRSCAKKRILVSSTPKDVPGSLQWNFSHDRMQQASYLLIPNGELNIFHLLIGRALRDKLDKRQFSKNLLMITNHLVTGAGLIESQNEKDQLAALCFRSGQRSVAQFNFEDAASFVESGLALLGESKWSRNYELCLSLFNAGAEICYVRAQFDRLEELTSEVFLQAKSFEDTIPSHTTHVYSLGSRHRLLEAIEEGRQVLDFLGEPLPKTFSPNSMRFEYYRTKRRLASLTERSLLDLRPMTDPKKLFAMRLLSLLYSYTFWAGDGRALLITYRSVQMSLLHGLCPMSGVAFSFYAGYTCLFGDVIKGNKYGDVAIGIIDRFDSKQWSGRVRVTVNSFVRPWSTGLRTLLPGTLAAAQHSFVTGDIEYAMLGHSLVTNYRFMSGEKLESCVQSCVEVQKRMLHHEQTVVLRLMEPLFQTMANLLGQSTDPLVLTGDFSDEDTCLKRHIAANNILGVCMFYLAKGVVAFFLDRTELALTCAQKCMGLKQGNMFAPMTHLQLFIEGMAHLIVDKPNVRRAKTCLSQLQWYSQFAPTVLTGKMALLEAEMASLKGDESLALEKYAIAIAIHQRQGIIHEQAYSCERAAVSLSRFGRTEESTEYLIEAMSLYRNWGCQLKVEHIEKQLSKI